MRQKMHNKETEDAFWCARLNVNKNVVDEPGDPVIGPEILKKIVSQ